MKFPLFFFFLLTIANAFASDLDFTLVNQTARSFEGIYITDSGNKDWDSNLLRDGKVLAAGGKVRVRFKSDAKIGNVGFQLGGRRGTLGNLQSCKAGRR